MAFLSNALREEGGFEFKKAILDGLLDIMETIPEVRCRASRVVWLSSSAAACVTSTRVPKLTV